MNEGGGIKGQIMEREDWGQFEGGKGKYFENKEERGQCGLRNIFRGQKEGVTLESTLGGWKKHKHGEGGGRRGRRRLAVDGGKKRRRKSRPFPSLPVRFPPQLFELADGHPPTTSKLLLEKGTPAKNVYAEEFLSKDHHPKGPFVNVIVSLA